jgi:hypothetical protein
MSWGVFPDGRTGLSSLLDPLLESSSLDPLESSLLDLLLASSSLDLWSLLCSTLYWNLAHVTLSEVFFIRPSTGVFFTRPLESSLIDPLLESCSLDPLWSLLYSTLYWGLLHLTLSEVFFIRPSTGVFFTWPLLESSLLDPLLESSLDPLWSLLYSTLYWSLPHLTFSGVFFVRPSTGIFLPWPSGVSFAQPLLEPSSLVWVSLSLSCFLVWVSRTNVHYRVHESPPPVRILSQIDPVHTFTPDIFDVHFLITVPLTSRSPKLSHPFRFPN